MSEENTSLNFLDAKKRLLDKTFAFFLQAPEREFDNGVKLKGMFQAEFKANNISKNLVDKLVKKDILKKAMIKMKKGGNLVFYVVNKRLLK